MSVYVPKPIDTQMSEQPATANIMYLVMFTLTLGVSSMEYGFVMAAPASAAKALRH